jgi:hypothetical protein
MNFIHSRAPELDASLIDFALGRCAAPLSVLWLEMLSIEAALCFIPFGRTPTTWLMLCRNHCV